MKTFLAIASAVYTLLMFLAVLWCWKQRKIKAAPAWYLDAMREGLAPVCWEVATDRQRLIVAIKYRLRD